MKESWHLSHPEDPEEEEDRVSKGRATYWNV
jgi:hypothetical protein